MQDLFSEVHTRRCYVSVEEEFKRRCSRTPMLLTQGRDQRSSPRSFTMDSSERNEAYKLLMELTMQLEHTQARLDI